MDKCQCKKKSLLYLVTFRQVEANLNRINRSHQKEVD